MKITLSINPMEMELLVMAIRTTDPTGSFIGRSIIPQIQAEYKKIAEEDQAQAKDQPKGA